jgi:hypothetical protein
MLAKVIIDHVAPSMFCRLTTMMVTAEGNRAGRRDIKTVGHSYSTGTGKLKARIPVKCLDQVPMPLAAAPPISQAR